MYTFQLNSLTDTERFAKILSEQIEAGSVILLSGDLGSGKTTFTQYFGKFLGVKRHMTSPTFNIIKSYKGIYTIHHMDCYRLEDSDEDLGFDEYFNDLDIAIVEWPQFIEEYLPEDFISIELLYIDESKRELKMKAQGNNNLEIVGAVYDQFTSWYVESSSISGS